MNIVSTIVGVVVVMITVADVVLTMVLPRRPSGIERVSLQVNRVVRFCFVYASHLAKTYERKDAILAPTGPVALVVQLLFWAAFLVLGFALILVGAGVSFADGLLQALTALFTVGAVHSGGPADTGVIDAIGAPLSRHPEETQGRSDGWSRFASAVGVTGLAPRPRNVGSPPLRESCKSTLGRMGRR